MPFRKGEPPAGRLPGTIHPSVMLPVEVLMKIRSVMILFSCMLVFQTAAGSAEDNDEEILARWEGGALGKDLFEELYDPSGNILAVGGDQFRRELARAAIVEIYSRRAIEEGLDRDSAVVGRIADWEREMLAGSYWKSSTPDFKADVKEAAMREYYRAHLKDIFARPMKVDFEMLFMRCGEEERQSCREKMEKLRKELLVSGEFSKKIEEFRSLYGRANGSFFNIDLKTIAEDVASVLSAIPFGEIGPLIETPIGIFLPRLLAKKESGAMSFDEVRERIRADLAARAADAWIEALFQRIKAAGFKCDDTMTALAAAARIEKLDENPTYLRKKKVQFRRELALAAMAADRTLMPDDDELWRKIRENPDLLPAFRKRHLLAALIDASKDRYRAFRLSEKVRSTLASAGERGKVFAQLGDLFSGVEVRDLGWFSMPEIVKLHPKFGDAVRDMQSGDFRGPIQISAMTRRIGASGSRREKLPPGFAFLYLEGIREQPLEAVRGSLFRAEASERIFDPAETVEQLKASLGLEILTDPSSTQQPARH